jgi:hypothetical protein
MVKNELVVKNYAEEAAVNHCGRHRVRSAGDSRREQAARDMVGSRRESSRFWRSSQVDVGRYRGCDGLQSDFGGAGDQTGKRELGGLGRRDEDHNRQRQHDDHQGRRGRCAKAVRRTLDSTRRPKPTRIWWPPGSSIQRWRRGQPCRMRRPSQL